ncbi:MAG: efflux RND transporter periplasmic adaptor subunit [Gemmatimonadota bacterium]
MQRRHWFVTGAAVALLIAVFAWAFRPQPVPVEVATVKRAAFEQTVDEDGKTRVIDRYVVSAPLAGTLARIVLEPGDAVTAGMTVARLTPAAPAMHDARTARELGERVGAADAAFAQAQANVARTDAALAQAQADLARLTKLRGEGFIAEAAVEQAELAVRVQTQALAAARFAVEAARHDMAQARAALMRARDGAGVTRPGTDWPIESPVAGRVLRVLQKSETAVGIGAPLLEIGDPTRLEAVVDVLSTEATRIATGARVAIDAGSGVVLDGRVRYVEPAAFTKVSALGIEEQRVNVVIDFTSPPAQVQRLGDGYRVDTRIVVQARADALVVPVAALFRDGAGWAVFIDEDGSARKRAVGLGGRNSSEAWVEQGLEPGARVIVYPSDRVADGKRVRVIRGD